MKFKKIVKRHGGGLVINLSKDEARIFNFKENDIVEFDNFKVVGNIKILKRKKK